MNYYRHHIGDYLRDTAHLSMLEDAAYRRLLDLYYTHEAPIPADLDQACRLVRARGDTERTAVVTVLAEFFSLEADGWHQKRADGEIEQADKARTNARTNGKSGGRPKKTSTVPQNNQEETHPVILNNQEETHRVILGNPDESSPSSILQPSQDGIHPSKVARARARGKTGSEPTGFPPGNPTRTGSEPAGFQSANPTRTGSEPTGFDVLDCPGDINREAWERWVVNRRKRHKPITEAGARGTWQSLAPLTLDEQAACIRDSIDNDYQGLFPHKFAARETPPRPRSMSFADELPSARDGSRSTRDSTLEEDLTDRSWARGGE